MLESAELHRHLMEELAHPHDGKPAEAESGKAVATTRVRPARPTAAGRRLKKEQDTSVEPGLRTGFLLGTPSEPVRRPGSAF
jgi:hypothetical protein